MKPYTVALTAGTPMPFPVGGEFFFLDSCPDGGVTVEFFGAGGLARGDQLESSIAGTWKRGNYSYLKLTSLTTQTIRFYVGSGDVGVNRFSGQVSGTLGVLAQLLVGGINAAQVTERGYNYGVAFASSTGLGAGANETILAPGSNVNGVIVWDAELLTFSTVASPLVALMAKAGVAPASMTDGDLLAIGACLSASAAGYTPSLSARLLRPVFVSASKGLYFRASSAESIALRKILYTVL